VLYNKGNEGALYSDNTSGAAKADDFVQPGGNHTYIWQVGRMDEGAGRDLWVLLWLLTMGDSHNTSWIEQRRCHRTST
jgi:hypothetical protein